MSRDDTARAAVTSDAARAHLLTVAACAVCGPVAAQLPAPSAFDLSIEELGRVVVTSASRRPERLNATPAAVYVISAEQIRRSGVTTLADALRLAPGVEVARNGSHEWTISLRGFNSDLSNKLLVLIDGRSVYSPLYAGVFWDVQDTLLADVERIEVVSGPGGAVWGANAVNGVINIITHTAGDTQGGRAEIVTGGEESFGAFRYGWRPAESIAARAYVKQFDRDPSELEDGGAAFDDWSMTRGGFALEWTPTDEDALNVRFDAYDGEESALLRPTFTLGTLPGADVPGTVPLSGHSIIANWRRRYSDSANWSLQFYFDHTDREIAGTFDEARDTVNVAFLHDTAPLGRHNLQWGVEYRVTEDDIGNTLFSSFLPPSRTDETASAFVSDRIELRAEKLFVDLGAKLEHNDYTGFEQQPNIRLTWLPDARQTVWAAVSHAVRVPARLNTDLQLFAPVPTAGAPLYVNVNGNPNFESEELNAYEAGYRVQLRDDLSLDVAVFDNKYESLQTIAAGAVTFVPGSQPYFLLPATLANFGRAESYGGTVVVNWQTTESWRLQFQLAHLQLDLAVEPPAVDNGFLLLAGNSPRHQAAVYSFLELPHDLALYTGVRYVDDLSSQGIPSYIAVDWTVGWQATERLRLSLTVRDANDARRREFGAGTFLERSALGRAVWTF